MLCFGLRGPARTLAFLAPANSRRDSLLFDLVINFDHLCGQYGTYNGIPKEYIDDI
jgi:hypothetical protein